MSVNNVNSSHLNLPWAGACHATSVIRRTLKTVGLRRLSLLLVILFVAGTFSCPPASSRQLGVKTNLLYDATATINLGAELVVAPRWSLDLSGNLNAWTFSHGRRWKHWLVQPEARYWLCAATTGHFFALHALGGQYNVGHLGFARDILGLELSHLRDHRYQGWFTGAGIGYGYSWTLGKHWSVEAELAVGWIYTRFDTFECEGCGRKVDNGRKSFFSPTKAAISLVYVF